MSLSFGELMKSWEVVEFGELMKSWEVVEFVFQRVDEELGSLEVGKYVVRPTMKKCWHKSQSIVTESGG